MRIIKFISFIFAIGCFNGQAQLTVNSLHYRNKIADALYYAKDTATVHSSILPAISQKKWPLKTVLCYRINPKAKKTHFIAYPLFNTSIGIESGRKKEETLLYNAGLGAGINFNSKKFFISAKFLPYATSSTFVADSIQQYTNSDLGASRSIFKNGFQQNEFIAAYQPNRFFTFIGGNGKNFFGEGYRSLILSDNAAANPFFKIETTFSSIKYVNLYQMWNNNTIDPTNKTLDRKKFAAMHYISWNITREFNLSIFESVVWQAKDTLVDRGFDPNYLNPIVFYRPVEYGNGSADNVLLGANMSFKFNKHHSIYTQFVLDDFLLSEIKARSRWWANKYGFQMGYKSAEFLKKENLYFQLEFNLVRPFTYSHKHAILSYGHLNSSVAHPIGANFIELVNIISYKTEKLRFTNKLTYSSYGVDTSAINYGQNIFISYTNRVGEHDHFLMQGEKKNVLNETLIIEMPLVNRIDLYANFTYNWRMEIRKSSIQNNHYFSIGVRSRIWNRYTDF